MAMCLDEFTDKAIIGQFRTFGAAGPVYQIMAPANQTESGDWLLRIHVPVSGEDTFYPYTQARTDPIAQ